VHEMRRAELGAPLGVAVDDVVEEEVVHGDLR
jgi:hypothetical protein